MNKDKNSTLIGQTVYTLIGQTEKINVQKIEKFTDHIPITYHFEKE